MKKAQNVRARRPGVRKAQAPRSMPRAVGDQRGGRAWRPAPGRADAGFPSLAEGTPASAMDLFSPRTVRQTDVNANNSRYTLTPSLRL
jgi:hypothetical protein